jgi:large subunit ribosomal protein L14
MVKEAILNMPLKNLEIVKAIVVHTCKELKHKNGTSVHFNDNVTSVINQERNLKRTCVFGPIA